MLVASHDLRQLFNQLFAILAGSLAVVLNHDPAVLKVVDLEFLRNGIFVNAPVRDGREVGTGGGRVAVIVGESHLVPRDVTIAETRDKFIRWRRGPIHDVPVTPAAEKSQADEGHKDPLDWPCPLLPCLLLVSLLFFALATGHAPFMSR